MLIEAHVYLGQSFLKKNMDDAALLEFKKALKIDPKYPRLRFFVGQVLRKKGEIQKAIEQFKLENNFNPNDGELHFNLALAYKDRQTSGQFPTL